MSLGINFVNKLTKWAHDTGEMSERGTHREHEEEHSVVHEKKPIPLNWDPTEFKDKVSSVWGMNLDFFDFPPVSFEEESVSWKKIFRENIFQPFLPKNRIVLEHFINHVQELIQLKNLQTLNNIDDPEAMEAQALQQQAAIKTASQAFKYEYAEKAIYQMKSIKKAAAKAAQASNFERRKRLYGVRANRNLEKFLIKINRLRQAEEEMELIPHKYYKIDLSMHSPPIENMLQPEEGHDFAEGIKKLIKSSSFRRHLLGKPFVSTSREGGNRPSVRRQQANSQKLPPKPRRKSCECSVCGGINDKEKKAYDLPNYINHHNVKQGLESSKISEESPLSPGASPFAKIDRDKDSKKSNRRFSWDITAMFDAAGNSGGTLSRKASGVFKGQAETAKKPNVSRFSKMKSETDEQLLTEGDTPHSQDGAKMNQRLVVSMNRIPHTLQTIDSINDIFIPPPRSPQDAKSLPMIRLKHRNTFFQPDPNRLKPIKPIKEGKLKLKKKGTPKKIRRTYEKNLNNTLSKFMILNAYVPSSATNRKSTSKDFLSMNKTHTTHLTHISPINTTNTNRSIEPKTPSDLKPVSSSQKPKISHLVSKKMNEILNPRFSLPSHTQRVFKSDGLSDSTTNITLNSPTNLTSTLTSPKTAKIKLKKLRIPSFSSNKSPHDN